MPLQTLSATSAIGAGVATLAVIAECAFAGVLTGRLPVAASRVTLRLRLIVGAVLILIGGVILLIEVGLLSAALGPVALLSAGLRAVGLRGVRAFIAVLR